MGRGSEMGGRENWQMWNQSTMIRLVGALALLSTGSFLFAEGLSNLLLLPVSLAVAGISGSQETSQVQAWQNQFVVQLTVGIICLGGSIFVAFFKFETGRSLVARTPLATQESLEGVRSRVPRTRISTQESLGEVMSNVPQPSIAKHESMEEVKLHVPQPAILTQESVEEIKLRLKKLQFIDSNLARKFWDALPKNIQREVQDNPGV